MASPQASRAGNLEPLCLLWTVDLALSPGSAVYVREHLGQEANVLHAPQNAEAAGLVVEL